MRVWKLRSAFAETFSDVSKIIDGSKEKNTPPNDGENSIPVFPYTLASAVIGNSVIDFHQLIYSGKISQREASVILAIFHVVSAYNHIRYLSLNSDEIKFMKTDINSLRVERVNITNLALIYKDLLNRRDFGLEKYRTVLKTRNGRNALLDAVEELLDCIQYLSQDIAENASSEVLVSMHESLLNSPLGKECFLGKFETKQPKE